MGISEGSRICWGVRKLACDELNVGQDIFWHGMAGLGWRRGMCLETRNRVIEVIVSFANHSVERRAENMRAALEMIETRYGGAEGYLRNKLGFSEDDIETMRKNLVEDDPSDLRMSL